MAERWAIMRNTLGTWVWSTGAEYAWPRGIQISQGISQRRLPKPRPTNIARHPKRAIAKAPTSEPSAGPLLVPASIHALVRPR